MYIIYYAFNYFQLSTTSSMKMFSFDKLFKSALFYILCSNLSPLILHLIFIYIVKCRGATK